MRPTLRFLTDELIEQIVAEAIDVLCSLGVTIHNPETRGYGGRASWLT